MTGSTSVVPQVFYHGPYGCSSSGRSPCVGQPLFLQELHVHTVVVILARPRAAVTGEPTLRGWEEPSASTVMVRGGADASEDTTL